MVRRAGPSVLSLAVVAGLIELLLFFNGGPDPRAAGPAVAAGASNHTPVADRAASAPTGSAGASDAAVAPTTPVVPTTNVASAAPSAGPAGSDPTPTAEASSEPVRPALVVLNNSTRSGLAHAAARAFQAGGWPIADVGNFTGRIAETTVYYGPGQEQAARALATQYPDITRVLPRFDGLPGQGLTVVLTRFWGR